MNRVDAVVSYVRDIIISFQGTVQLCSMRGKANIIFKLVDLHHIPYDQHA